MFPISNEGYSIFDISRLALWPGVSDKYVCIAIVAEPYRLLKHGLPVPIRGYFSIQCNAMREQSSNVSYYDNKKHYLLL